jgi:phosphate transport system protein
MHGDPGLAATGAKDLRFIVTVLKINIDLEWIGDLAAKVADKVVLPNTRQTPLVPLAVSGGIMAELDKIIADTPWMLTGALDAFAREDRDLALQVIRTDERVDLTKNLIRSLLEENFFQDHNEHQYLATVLSITRSLERIADHATNICEDVIYLLSGNIIRHRNTN